MRSPADRGGRLGAGAGELEPRAAPALTRPIFYHLDLGIQREPQARWIHNATPFLINLCEQWALRPGLCPLGREALGEDVEGWADLYPAPARPRLPGRGGDARPPAAHGEIRYGIAHDRWVLAGTYMATYTRLNTMEAANESARHAVNAILEHELAAEREGEEPSRRRRRGLERATRKEPFAAVAGGDLCEVWNPEEHEWEDLEPLKRLDAALHEEGLPHFLDILRVPEALAAVPHRKRNGRRPLYDLARLFELSQSVAVQEMSPFVEGVDGIGQAIEEHMAQLLRRLSPERD